MKRIGTFALTLTLAGAMSLSALAGEIYRGGIGGAGIG